VSLAAEKEKIMVVVRNVFQLKFGQARPAAALWKEGLQVVKRVQPKQTPRLLTDIVGTSYTVVFETTHESLADFEQSARVLMANDDWQKWYQKLVPLVESGYREIFTVVD
jgi:hypothetical protein